MSVAQWFNKRIKQVGPGIVTGASDDDPSGIATYSQVGAQFGFSLLWMALFSFPLMAIVQEMCARLGLVTKKGLAANMRVYFPRWFVYVTVSALVIANTFNISADISAMIAATQLLFPLPTLPILLVLVLGSILVQVLVPYHTYANVLKWLTLSLFAYIVSGFVVKLPFALVIQATVIPHIPWDVRVIPLIAAVLGTTISPYLFFWQSSQEVEDLKDKRDMHVKRNQIKFKRILNLMRIDVGVGMFFSNIVMFFIIAVTAATLHSQGITTIDSAAQAAQALRPLAGDFAFLLFSIGIIGTGLLALPVLAGSSAYAVSDLFGWRQGLGLKFTSAPTFYLVIILSMVVGMLLPLLGVNPIQALLASAVLNAVVAAPLILMITYLTSKHQVMGDQKNVWFVKMIGYGVGGLMMIVGIVTLLFLFYSL